MSKGTCRNKKLEEHKQELFVVKERIREHKCGKVINEKEKT